MKGLYIASTACGSGKSLFSFSLGVLLQQNGYSVGFMKPVGRLHQKVEERTGDADALVIQEILGQNAAADTLSPLMLPQHLHDLLAMKEIPANDQPLERVTKAYELLSSKKDIMLVSGTGSFPSTGCICGADGLALVNRLSLGVILVERFHGAFAYDAVLHVKEALGSSCLGIVLNDVPDSAHRDVCNVLTPFLEQRGIPVLGILPHRSELTAIRIFDLADALNGRIIAGNANASRMIEGFVIGSMQVDNFMTHLRQQSTTSAIIVGGDRADLQLAALHAASPCLVLTGNHSPCEMVRVLAEKKKVPLICVREDTYSVAQKMSTILRTKKISELGQIRTAVQLVSENISNETLRFLVER